MSDQATFDPLYDPPRDASDIYDRIESALCAEDGYEAVEAHDDGLLIVASDGREWWLTAKEQT